MFVRTAYDWWLKDGYDSLVIHEEDNQYTVHKYIRGEIVAGPFDTLEAAKLAYLMLHPHYMVA